MGAAVNVPRQDNQQEHGKNRLLEALCFHPRRLPQIPMVRKSIECRRFWRAPDSDHEGHGNSLPATKIVSPVRPPERM